MADPVRYPRKEALAVAEEIYNKLRPYCERCKVVGSLRRGRHTVKDIEFLFIPILVPQITGLFGETEDLDSAGAALDRMVENGYLGKRPNSLGITAWGPKNKLAIHVASGIPIDFFATTERNWWVSLVVRTGGKDTNLELTKSAQKRGFTLHAYGEGVENRKTGEIIACNSEREVFAACGLPYKEPAQRI